MDINTKVLANEYAELIALRYLGDVDIHGGQQELAYVDEWAELESILQENIEDAFQTYEMEKAADALQAKWANESVTNQLKGTR